jgi:TPP-dependent trihydroxycyclohexane-1,2-dione (THcHDO) dehydratase
VNVGAFDAHKHGAATVVGDADAVLEALAARSRAGARRTPGERRRRTKAGAAADAVTRRAGAKRPAVRTRR